MTSRQFGGWKQATTWTEMECAASRARETNGDEQTCQLITVEEANNYRYFCFICDLNEYFYLISSHE